MAFFKRQNQDLKASLSRGDRAYVIAITAVSAGAGVTHQAIMLANFIRRNGLKTAVVELNNSRAFARLEEALGYEGELDSFKFKGVDYIKNIDKNSLDRVLDSDYDVIIFDMSVHFRKYRDVFLRADIPVVMIRYSDWNLAELDEFILENQDFISDRIRWMAAFIDEKDVSFLSKKYKRRFYLSPFLKDAFVKDDRLDVAFNRLFV